ncbi:MAG TPA: prepilin peptidase, partial [Candidatus Saccharimonadia bacterium]
MLYLLVSCVLGLIVGSFLNVVILRVHAGKQFIRGRSACPHCHHQLSALEMIPVISWLVVRGRCRHCRKPISIQYPLVELVTAGLFALSYVQFKFNDVADVIFFGLWLYVLGSMIVLAVYDIRWYLLPDKVLVPLIIPALLVAAGQAFMSQSYQPLLSSIGAALLFGGFFYSLAAVSKGKWMGGGDIKLAFVMGLILGLQKTLLAMFIAFNTAALVGVLLILMKRTKPGNVIPFGPFLIG